MIYQITLDLDSDYKLDSEEAQTLIVEAIKRIGSYNEERLGINNISCKIIKQ